MTSKNEVSSACWEARRFIFSFIIPTEFLDNEDDVPGPSKNGFCIAPEAVTTRHATTMPKTCILQKEKKLKIYPRLATNRPTNGRQVFFVLRTHTVAHGTTDRRTGTRDSAHVRKEPGDCDEHDRLRMKGFKPTPRALFAALRRASPWLWRRRQRRPLTQGQKDAP